ncbi:MAG: ribosome maturation factor RimP [Deltaproteobacteria bacterium]|nr:MAG: ribosome maturation factor RimP [Deltaproteobacteria bacterium]
MCSENVLLGRSVTRSRQRWHAVSQSMEQQLWALIEPVVVDHGFELVELEYVRQKEWLVRLFIERPNVTIVPGLGVAPGEGVGLDDCAKVSRELSAILDVEDVVSHQYRLEVSSPGVQRPLRKWKDYEAFLGCEVKVRSFGPIAAVEPDGANPSRNFSGVLDAVDRDKETIELLVDNRRYRIPLNQIAKAHLDPDMEEWMALAKKRRKESQSG